MSTTVKHFFEDLTGAISAHRLCWYMASRDISMRYRGSTLGPLWITLSMSIFIAAISVVYSRIFNLNYHEYIPYLTCGTLIWTYISAVINESSQAFISSKEFIEGMKIPYLLFIFSMISKNILIFLHNFVVYILMIVLFQIPINLNILLSIPGFLLVTALLTPLSVIFSLLGTRFRDLPPIITSIMTVIFFISPVTWKLQMVGEQSAILRLNPVSYLLDLIRTPLLGGIPHAASVYVTLTLTLIFWMIALIVFTGHSKKIPFWL